MGEKRNQSAIDSDNAARLRDHPTVQSILTLDIKYINRTFAIILFVLVIVMLVDTRRYDWEETRGPLVIGAGLVILLVIELFRQFDIVDLELKYKTRRRLGLTGSLDENLVGATTEEMTGRSLLDRRTDLASSLTWILFLFVVVLLLGLLPGSLVFLLLYYGLEARVGFLRTIVYSAAVWLFLWIMFEFFLQARLYAGFFDIGEFFYV